jgi:serine protease Do
MRGSWLCALTLFSIVCWTNLAFGDELGDAVRAAVSRVEPSIVRLLPAGSNANDDTPLSVSMSTGIVISEKGEILTSAFSLQGNPAAIVVETSTGQRFAARVVARDFLRQLVLLQADGGSWKTTEFQPRTAAKIGQWVVAAGRFYSAERSNISVGIVSARDRIHGLALQTDAKISPVNYGGPLIDLSGGVHGILVPLSAAGSDDITGGVEWYDSGVGFAIPMEDALKSVERMRGGKNLYPGRLGISLVSKNPISNEVRISDIHPGGPADRAGLKAGDRIQSVNGIPAVRVSLFQSLVESSYAGDQLSISAERTEAEPITCTVELVERLTVLRSGFVGLLPRSMVASGVTDLPAETPADTDKIKGKDADNQSPQTVPARSPKDAAQPGAGAVVLERSPAQTAGMKGSVQILSVNDQPVNNETELTRALQTATRSETVRISWTNSEKQNPEIAVVSVSPPSTLQPVLSSQNRLDYLGLSAVTEAVAPPIARQEFEFSDLGKCAVLSAGSQDTAMPALGMVLLLSDSTVPEDRIMRTWKTVLHTHRLAVVIPSNADQTPLTSEDLPLIVASMTRVVTELQIDRSRIAVVADASEHAIAQKLIFSARSPIRGVVMRTGLLTPAESDSPDRAGRSALLLDRGGDLQSRLLRRRTLVELQETGLRVFSVSDEAEEPSAEKATAQNNAEFTDEAAVIADWSLLMKAF